jgi:DNA replication ATP-dependent helicase Dna2
VNVQGTVLSAGDPRTVTTQYGERDLVDVLLLLDTKEKKTITLWGDWAETADYLQQGMELLVTEVDGSEFDGEEQYATTGDSFVVVEPSFLVNVTDIRSWVQCPRMHYLNKISGTPLNYPVVKGTTIHKVFGDLLRGRDLNEAVADRVDEAGLELGLLDRDPAAVRNEVFRHGQVITHWLQQGTLTEDDQWRSEYTLVSETFGIKGRCDAIRRDMPIELKSGKNTKKDARFQDKVQVACYALLLQEQEHRRINTGTVLYTKNATLDRGEATGDLSPAKEFSVSDGLLNFVVRERNKLAAMAFDKTVPTGYEADATCDYCFEQDHCLVVSGRLDQDGKAGKIGTAVPDEEQEYFTEQYQFLEDERRAIHEEYAKLWEQSAEERAADNRALIGLEPVDTQQFENGRWELRARRRHDAVSKIREGDLVLASSGDPIRGEVARVEQLGNDEIVVTADEPVDLRRLDVYPSEITIDRTLTAVYDCILKGDDRRKDILFDRCDPAFDDHEETFIENNTAQNRAVNTAANANDFALIHGPPGTGKTYTIARLIRALVSRGDRVLVSSLTNRAVDNVLKMLREQGFEDFLRIGSETGIQEDMLDVRLETRGADAAPNLREASVVAATTASCGSRTMREQEFDVAVVDEAAQLTEPQTLAAINLADRFVLVGDHKQLPAVTQTEAPPSLFERLIETYPIAGVMLDRQYRMAQRIQAFPSQEFYDGELRPANIEVASQRLAELDAVATDELPAHLQDQVTFVDVNGEMTGNTNATEADQVAEIVTGFEVAGVSREDIGVIAPFRAQVAEIARRVPTGVAVDTVDRFQGSSKEVIIISFVATESLESPIFEDNRRLNVALTRPRKALVLVGNAETLRKDEVYGRMLTWSTATQAVSLG